MDGDPAEMDTGLAAGFCDVADVACLPVLTRESIGALQLQVYSDYALS
jgi:hypothetical protein